MIIVWVNFKHKNNGLKNTMYVRKIHTAHHCTPKVFTHAFYHTHVKNLLKYKMS